MTRRDVELYVPRMANMRLWLTPRDSRMDQRRLRLTLSNAFLISMKAMMRGDFLIFEESMMLERMNRLSDADRFGRLPACDSGNRFISSTSEESLFARILVYTLPTLLVIAIGL